MKPTILVTDDERNIRLMLRTSLESEGYAVREAAEGRQALLDVDRFPPDLMILDLNMPGMDGMTVLERMNSMPRFRMPPVIVLTAHGSIPAAVRATRLGAVDFLEKPVIPADVRDAVSAALHEAPRPQGPAIDELERSYAKSLDQVREELRMGKFESAESVLHRIENLPRNDAAHLNLLGILYEAQHKWRLARKFYGKAMSADRSYVPAQRNMRRLYELTTFGKSAETVALGDSL